MSPSRRQQHQLDFQDYSPEKKWYQRGIPARYILVVMGFLGFANVYALRVNLSIAIVSMVNHTALHELEQEMKNTSDLTLTLSNITVEEDVCPKYGNSSAHHVDAEGPFVWSENQQGLLLGSFFYGYIITQYPGGRLAEIFGGKMIFGVGIFFTAFFTLLTPIAATGSYTLLIAVRIAMGLGEGVTYPVMMALVAKWAPPQERSMMVSIIYGGVSFGTLVSTPMAGQLSKYLGWEWVFYVLGIIAMVWCICWQFLCYDSPEKHPRISEEERRYIKESQTGEDAPSLSTPWKAMLMSVPLWALTVTHVAYAFTNLFLLTELPTYMRNILYYNIEDNGNLIAMFYLVSMIVAIVAPIIMDFIIAKRWVSRTVGRKIANSVGTFGPALALIGVCFSGCNTTLIMVLFGVAKGTMGAIFAGQHSNMIDLAPNFAGTIMGILNTLGNVMGFVAPQVTGAIINHHETLTRWHTVFFLAAGINIAGSIVYLVFGSAEEQHWNSLANSEKRETEKKEAKLS